MRTRHVRPPAGRRGPAPFRALLRSALGLVLVAALAACEGGPPADGSSGSGSADQSEAAAAVPDSAPGTAASEGARPDTQRVDISDLGVNAGVPGAPIQVVEFSDFGCPHCRSFHMNTYPTIYREYVQTGHVIWKYVPLAFGMFPNSLPATRAGHCAMDQTDFAPMRDELFRNQLDWMRTEAPRDLFIGYAEEVGLDVERFRSCLEEGTQEEEIQQAIDVANRIGVNGTPTFFIQGQKVEGERSTDFFRQVFDQMLAQIESQGGSSGGS